MARSDNDILKRTLRHYIDLEYYANGVDEEIQELLEILLKECDAIISSQDSYNTKSAYSLAYKAIKEKVDGFGNELEKRLEREAELVRDEESDFLTKLYGSALTVEAISLSNILFAPIDGRDTTKQFVERTTKNILRSYDTSMRAGYLFGQNSEDIKAQTATKLKQVARGIQSGIRTAIPSYAKTTDNIIFLNNNTEVVYCAVLDGRTCIVCGNNHGLHFKSIATAPLLPIHCGCRCYYILASAVTEPMPTYEEYIESLSDEEQYHILGKNRYEMWKNYGIKLNQFVNNGMKLTLDELRKEYEDKLH